MNGFRTPTPFNVTLPQSSTIKYLGVILDDKLNQRDQIEKTFGETCKETSFTAYLSCLIGTNAKASLYWLYEHFPLSVFLNLLYILVDAEARKVSYRILWWFGRSHDP